MVTGDPLVPGPAALAEAKSYLRIEGPEEDALIERLVGSAVALCEQFTGQVLIARGFAETLAASSAWARLHRSPVVAIAGVEALTDAGASALPAGSFAIDIDASGYGWVRLTGTQAAPRMRVSYTAGMGAQWAELPEPLRQGAVRLAAHLYSNRSASDDAGPPAVVTALWRPYRRMRLS